MTNSRSVSDQPSSRWRAALSGRSRTLAFSLATLLVASALAWQAGALPLLGVALAAGGGFCLPRPRAARDENSPQPDNSPAPPGARAPAGTSPAPRGRNTDLDSPGGSPMISEVVPVWARQLDATRSSADAGLSNILQVFAEMSGSLDQLLGSLEGISASTRPGAVDGAVVQSSPALDALMAPSARAFELRNLAVAELDGCHDSLTELMLLARQASEIGRHTRLVAFNASIEASRSESRDGGNGAVAQEMRQLSTRMAGVGSAVQRVVGQLQTRLDAVRHASVTQETTPEELRMEIELRARDALQALLAAVGASLSTSSAVREASSVIRQNLDNAFVHFQFGDRVSQMLSIIGNDMNNFVEWMSRNPDSTQDDAIEWLQRLEASYTMEEQRSEHHGNVHVDRGSEVEYF